MFRVFVLIITIFTSLLFSSAKAEELSHEDKMVLSLFADVLDNDQRRKVLIENLRATINSQPSTQNVEEKTEPKSENSPKEEVSPKETKSKAKTDNKTTADSNTKQLQKEKSTSEQNSKKDQNNQNKSDKANKEDNKKTPASNSKSQDVKADKKESEQNNSQKQSKEQEKTSESEKAVAEENSEENSQKDSEKTENAEENKDADAPKENKENKDKENATEVVIEKVTENTKAAVSKVAVLPKKIADYVVGVFSTIWKRIHTSYDAAKRVFTGQDYRIQNLDWANFWHESAYFVIVIIATAFIFHLFAYLLKKVFAKLDTWSNNGKKPASNFLRKTLAISFTTILDCVNVVIASLGAYGVANYLSPHSQSLMTQSIIFINVFTVIELIKVGLSIVFRYRYPALRILNADNYVVRYWYRWLATIVNLLGYGFFVFVPFIDFHFSYSLSQMNAALLAIFTFIYGTRVVILKRRNIRDACLGLAYRNPYRLTRLFLRLVAYLWAYLTLAYFVMVLSVTLQSGGQKQALTFLLLSTLKTIVIIGCGLLLSTLLNSLLQKRFSIRRMPNLSSQLNFYIPMLLHLLRLLVITSVVFGLLAAWKVAKISVLRKTWGTIFIDKLGGITLIVALAILIWLGFCAFVEQKTNSESSSARTKTLLSLAKSAFAVLLFSAAAILLLAEVGINPAPLIAGAGVVGLAVGFGAQTLVKDVITGVFLQLENAIHINDYVTVDGISGWAERISIRSVTIRDLNGVSHLIPFSGVSIVSNYMRDFAYHTAEYGIAYNEDIDQATQVLNEAFAELVEGDCRSFILDNINIEGVTSLGDSSVNIRVRIKTLPGKQWAVGRAYNRLVKIYFDRAGIEIPYPHQTLYFGMQKDGTAPPLFIARNRQTQDVQAPSNKKQMEVKVAKEKEKKKQLLEQLHEQIKIEKTSDGGIKVYLPS